MRKKKKSPAGAHDDGQARAPAAPASIANQLGAALRDAGLAKLPDRKTAAAAKAKAAAKAPAQPIATKPAAAPASDLSARVLAHEPSAPAAPAARPRSKYTAGELSALGDAYRGVRPIHRAQKPTRVTAKPKEPVIDAQALQADREARERLGALVGGGVRFDLQLESDGFVQAVRQGASRKALAIAQSSGFAPESTLDLHGQRAADAALRVHDFVRTEHRNGARRLLIIVGKGMHSEGGVGVLGGIVREALSRGGAAPLVQAFASAHDTLGGRGALAVLLR